MDPFVNPNKRGVELPKGNKDLVDILRAKKCMYCDDVAVTTLGWPGDFRWCEACQRDLAEFAKIECAKFMLVTRAGAASDEAAVSVSQYQIELKRREEDFMRQKVRERRPQ